MELQQERVLQVRDDIIKFLENTHNALIKINTPFSSFSSIYELDIIINQSNLIITIGKQGDDIYVVFPKEIEYFKEETLRYIISQEDDINAFLSILDKYVKAYTKNKDRYIEVIDYLIELYEYGSTTIIYYDPDTSKAFVKNLETGRILVIIPDEEFTNITIGDMYNFTHPIKIDCEMEDLNRRVGETIYFFK